MGTAAGETAAGRRLIDDELEALRFHWGERTRSAATMSSAGGPPKALTAAAGT